MTSGCANKDPKTAMTNAANQLVAAVEAHEKEMQTAENLEEVRKAFASYKTKVEAIRRAGFSGEFINVFGGVRGIVLLEDFLIKFYRRSPSTCCPAPGSVQNDTPPQIAEIWTRLSPLRDAMAARFKAVCQELELDVQFNAPFWDAADATTENTPDEPPTEQPISPLDLPPVIDEDLDALREKILAEEWAKELALIEEERNFVPLVDDPDALIPLSPQHPIWVTPDRISVVLTGRVVLREGFLELLACRVGSKEHESILAVRVEPHLIHAALLVVNARQGRPMQMSPVFTPATGDRIDITLHWKDESGTQHESPAQDWIWDMSNSPEDAKKPMTTHWVFSGSRMVQDYEGNDRYLADATGELFGLSNFVGSILDVPIRSSDDNAELMFGCFTERIPPEDMLITIILTPME